MGHRKSKAVFVVGKYMFLVAMMFKKISIGFGCKKAISAKVINNESLILQHDQIILSSTTKRILTILTLTFLLKNVYIWEVIHV